MGAQLALASVSVDLDGLSHYCAIHGLPNSLLSPAAHRLIYEGAVPRFAELFAEVGLPATYFAIGDDLQDPAAQQALRAVQRQGAEVASHSGAHDYRLSRLSPGEIRSDLERAHQAITQVVGRPPVGFRAPGYILSPVLLAELIRLGYRYDSSVFPSPPYYLAKAAVRGCLALRGSPSASILDRPRVLAAPRTPYRPSFDEPYARGAAPILELPISVSPYLRWPLVGTFAVGSTHRLTRWAYLSLRSELAELAGLAVPVASDIGHLNFELHGVDLLDASDGIPAQLVGRQRDLRIAWRLKRERLRAILSQLRQDFEPVTLAEAAERWRGRVDA